MRRLSVDASDVQEIHDAAVALGAECRHGARRLDVSLLHKDNLDWQDEPRVPAGNPEGGQWTSDDDSGSNAAVSERDLAMSPECLEEWAAARRFCGDLLQRGLLGKGGYRGFGLTYDQCVRGQVSAACGGNPVG